MDDKKAKSLPASGTGNTTAPAAGASAVSASADTGTTTPPAAGAAAVGASADTARFEVRTPSTSFQGERMGVKFRDGRGYTDDAIRAHALLELGYSYFDRKTRQTVPAPAGEKVKEAEAEDDGVKKK